MNATNFIDLAETPEKVQTTIDMMVRNTVHLARQIEANPYPGSK